MPSIILRSPVLDLISKYNLNLLNKKVQILLLLLSFSFEKPIKVFSLISEIVGTATPIVIPAEANLF